MQLHVGWVERSETQRFSVVRRFQKRWVSPLAQPNLQELEQASLQAVDYFVWALQRLYERGEERYVTYLWQAFRLVQDFDDRRETGPGVYYTQKSRSMR